jgi:hypothetical protein
MPRYFFHIHDTAVTHDEEGQVLPNLECARERRSEEPLN